MIIRNVKIGDVIRMFKARGDVVVRDEDIEGQQYRPHKVDYLVTGVYPHFVECVMVKKPNVFESFSHGDLVIAGIENGMANWGR